MEEMTLKEFSLKVRKTHGKCKYSHSYGVRDYYRYYNNHKPKGKEFNMTEMTFGKILHIVNAKLAKTLISDGVMSFPYNFGRLVINRIAKKTYFDENGKLKTTREVDWKATIEYWHSDRDAMERKELIRFSDSDTYSIRFSRMPDLSFKNRNYFEFSPMRSLKNALKKAIREDDDFNIPLLDV